MALTNTLPKAIILVVEDESLLRMAGVAMVEDAGFEAIEASNAEEAIRLLESRDDVRPVFTDIDMPPGSMNGLKLAAAVRDRWPPIAIIIASGNRVPQKSDMPEGAVFFAKPYQQDAIMATMQDMLRAA
jgi:CheY-like chemotaxis protein